jgi:hypothetical protein
MVRERYRDRRADGQMQEPVDVSQVRPPEQAELDEQPHPALRVAVAA